MWSHKGMCLSGALLPTESPDFTVRIINFAVYSLLPVDIWLYTNGHIISSPLPLITYSPHKQSKNSSIYRSVCISLSYHRHDSHLAEHLQHFSPTQQGEISSTSVHVCSNTYWTVVMLGTGRKEGNRNANETGGKQIQEIGGNMMQQWMFVPVSVAARSKAWVCGRSPAKTVGLNPMDVCLLWVLCVVRQRSMHQADHSSRGVLPTVVRRCVWSRNPVNEEALAHWGLLHQIKKMNVCITNDTSQ
jgi:hypothetical protein